MAVRGVGRPKKSIEQRLREGSYNPKKHGKDLAMTGIVLHVPSGLSKAEKAKFSYLSGILQVKKMNHIEYMDIMVMLAKNMVEIDEMKALIKKDGYILTSKTGVTKLNPLINVVKASERHLLYLLREIGFTPASRSRTTNFEEAFDLKSDEGDFFD